MPIIAHNHVLARQHVARINLKLDAERKLNTAWKIHSTHELIYIWVGGTSLRWMKLESDNGHRMMPRHIPGNMVTEKKLLNLKKSYCGSISFDHSKNRHMKQQTVLSQSVSLPLKLSFSALENAPNWTVNHAHEQDSVYTYVWRQSGLVPYKQVKIGQP